MVVGADGQEYGPAGVDVLKQWVAENRLGPETILRNFQTGVTTPAGQIAELYPPAPASTYVAPPTQAQYPRSQAQAAVTAGPEIRRSILYAVVAVAWFYLLGGTGLVAGIYGIVYSVQVIQKGHKAGPICLALSIVALGAVCAGWALGLQGGMFRR